MPLGTLSLFGRDGPDTQSNTGFLRRLRGWLADMSTSATAPGPRDPERKELLEIVPARAVLTELARGFLLVRDTNPDRAVRFAATFLKERAGEPKPERVETVPKLTLARLALGRSPHGPVEPFGPPPR